MSEITNAVVDLSHFNANPDFAAAAQAGLIGVIHKATEGLAWVDPTYAARRGPAQAAGLLWGAYHFGVGGDGVAQAQAFLKTVGDVENVLLVLDFEANTTGPSMSLQEACDFVTQVQAQTGRWPGLYSGGYIKGLPGAGAGTALANCWFWLSEYGLTAHVPPTWSTWTLWQYTDGTIGPGPHETPGVGVCDHDQFNGDAAALNAFWSSGAP